MTSEFSKKFENHVASMRLLVAYYNLCRVHSEIRKIPAMALRVTDQAGEPPRWLKTRRIAESLAKGGEG